MNRRQLLASGVIAAVSVAGSNTAQAQTGDESWLVIRKELPFAGMGWRAATIYGNKLDIVRFLKLYNPQIKNVSYSLDFGQSKDMQSAIPKHPYACLICDGPDQYEGAEYRRAFDAAVEAFGPSAYVCESLSPSSCAASGIKYDHGYNSKWRWEIAKSKGVSFEDFCKDNPHDACYIKGEIA